MSEVEEEEEGEMLEGMSTSIPDGRQIQRKENAGRQMKRQPAGRWND